MGCNRPGSKGLANLPASNDLREQRSAELRLEVHHAADSEEQQVQTSLQPCDFEMGAYIVCSGLHQHNRTTHDRTSIRLRRHLRPRVLPARRQVHMAHALHRQRAGLTHRRILNPLRKSREDQRQRRAMLLRRAHGMYRHLPNPARVQRMDHQQPRRAREESRRVSFTPSSHSKSTDKNTASRR